MHIIFDRGNVKKARILLASLSVTGLLFFGPFLSFGKQDSAGVHADGIYFVAHRTQNHITRSSPDVFHRVANTLIAYLKSAEVKIIEDPERGILQTDESFSNESLLNLTRNAGATLLLLVTVDRPATKWLKVTVQAYDLTGKLLWMEEVSSGGGLTGAGAPDKVLRTLQKKLEPRLGKQGLPRQPSPVSTMGLDSSSREPTPLGRKRPGVGR